MRSNFVIYALLIICLCQGFQIPRKIDYAAQGFKSFASKFGDKIWHRNNTDSEDSILESTEKQMNQEIYKSSLDTILDLTKNPKRQK